MSIIVKVLLCLVVYVAILAFVCKLAGMNKCKNETYKEEGDI